ncbi:hypothetical protein XENOCAPTIV_014983, partial [Xenoophorus captivus]
MEVPDIKLHVTFVRGCFIQDGSLSADLCNHSSALFRIKVLKVQFCLRVVPLRESFIDSGVADKCFFHASGNCTQKLAKIIFLISLLISFDLRCTLKYITMYACNKTLSL